MDYESWSKEDLIRRLRATETLNKTHTDFIIANCKHLEVDAKTAYESNCFFSISGHYYLLPQEYLN